MKKDNAKSGATYEVKADAESRQLVLLGRWLQLSRADEQVL